MTEPLPRTPSPSGPPATFPRSSPVVRAARPSRPRAPRCLRIVVYLLLLALACAAIWWIDRGAMFTNVTH